MGKLTAFFTKGNIVVRIGLIVLLFGVAFLLKYTAEHNLVSIEMRLCSAAALGLTILGTGWYLRKTARIYGLLLQGGAIGILYLTLFASARIYNMIPIELAGTLMIALVILSGTIAVLLNAPGLAQLGTLGGFLAPVLISTSTGNHVMLFSYYTLLNAGVLGISWFKTWRLLNLTGFIFTFAISSIWGYQYYKPFYYASTQPFLIIFFLLYITISILFALRMPVRLRGYVDTTLVFGLPVIASSMQASLVFGDAYKMAVSSLITGAFYIILASTLWKKKGAGLKLLTEAFLALGVIFTSLSIPLALDAEFSSALWALEGAALIWTGIYQMRLSARLFGILLQFGAGVIFISDIHVQSNILPFINEQYLGGVIIAFAGFFSSYFLQHNSQLLHLKEKPFHTILLVWGILWWCCTNWAEIDYQFSRRHEIPAIISVFALSATFMNKLCKKLNWKSIGYAAAALLPYMVAVVWFCFEKQNYNHLFHHFGLPAWAIAFAIQYYLLYSLKNIWHLKLNFWYHLITFWLLVFIITWEAAWCANFLIKGSKAWMVSAWGITPVFILAALFMYGKKIKWPIVKYVNIYTEYAPLPVILLLFMWSIDTFAYSGNASPLPYIPIANPLDLTQLFILLVIIWAARQATPLKLPPFFYKYYMWLPGSTAFIWLNIVIARTIHHWAGIPYSIKSLNDSTLFQAAISILWGLSSLVLMVIASRSHIRKIWFCGATLLCFEVIKLFFIDLSGKGTIFRIVSFLAVGILMLIIGFFSPLPPADIKKELP